MTSFHKSLTRLALILTLLVGIVLPTQAANLPASLRGTYQLKSVSVKAAGLNIRPPFGKINLPIGAKGLSVITSAKVKNLLKTSGVGSSVNATITKTSATTFSFIATGKLTLSDYTLDITSATGKATLTAAGLSVKVNFTATLFGVSYTGTENILLKKAI